ncbi:MAG: urate hydroxylase PuuD, partial [bacterium]
MLAGEQPDPKYGRWGKQRSVHNNYLTLPVVFVMISGHYPMTWGHPHAWAVLVAVFVIGALVRHFFNRRHAGRTLAWLPVIAALLVIALALAIRPQPPKAAQSSSFAEVQAVIAQRCASCHAATPTQPGFAQPPGGVMLDTPERIGQHAAKIHQQSVLTRAMPPGHRTGLT